MSHIYDGKPIKIWAPATYHIQVEGQVSKSWSGLFVNMHVSTRFRKDNSSVTTLIGRVRDQAELSGLLNSLYDQHLVILSVELLEDEDGNH